jgi:hypothetical protein
MMTITTTVHVMMRSKKTCWHNLWHIFHGEQTFIQDYDYTSSLVAYHEFIAVRRSIDSRTSDLPFPLHSEQSIHLIV